MRRFAALMAVPVLAVAGCSGSGDASASTGPTPKTGAAASTPAPVDPSAAAAADKALSGNTKAICDQAARTGTSFGQTFIADLQLQIDAASKGAAAKAQAQQKIDRDVSNYSSALSGMAKLADDKALKSALTQMSKQVKALKGDVTKINATKMARITATLDSACGKG
jgi:ABC-type phosphate transport system substrate-binding protein